MKSVDYVSFRARWLNRRIWRWRRNKIKHRIRLLFSKRFREEMREYEALLAKEKAEVQAVFESLPEKMSDLLEGK